MVTWFMSNSDKGDKNWSDSEVYTKMQRLKEK